MSKTIKLILIAIALIAIGAVGTLLKVRQHQRVEAGYQAAGYISALIKLGVLPNAQAVEQALEKQAATTQNSSSSQASPEAKK